MIDGDVSLVAFCKGEVITRDETGSRHQITALREIHVAVEPGRQIRAFSFYLADRYLAGIHLFPAPPDDHTDLSGRRDRLGRNIQTGAECGAALIYFRLRQIKRVFSFDAAGTHIVTDGIALDRTRGIYK